MNCYECHKNIAKIIRGYCNACYVRLIRQGKILKIEKPTIPSHFTDEQQSLIVGSMLGDGSLYNMRETTQKCSIKILRNEKDRSYLEWEYFFLKEFCSSDIKSRSVYDDRTNKYYYNCSFFTRSSKLFGEFYNKWYPNGKKIVPNDIQLNSLIMAIWFLDDGNVYVRKNAPHRFEVKFATDGFTKNNVEFLADLLCKRYNEYYGVCKHENNYIINASGYASRILIKDIDRVIPIGIMNRKTKFWRNELSKINEDIDGGHTGKLKSIQYKNDFKKCLIDLYNNGIYEFSRIELGKILNWNMLTNGKIRINCDMVERYIEKYIKINLIEFSHTLELRRMKVYKFTDEFKNSLPQLENKSIQDLSI